MSKQASAESETASIGYLPHAFQRKFHQSPARHRIVVAGRQSGKTLAAVHECANWAMSAPITWPSVKFPQYFWTTAYDKTRGKAWRDFGANVPKEIIARSHESEAWFELKNGSRISMRSAEGMTSLVSETLHGLVCDEFCQYRPQVYDEYLAPMLATTGGPVVFVGSPWGMNWGYETYMKGLVPLPGWQSFHWTSYDSPYIDKLWLAERKIDTADRSFRQQYMAEFLTAGGEVFRNVDTCIAPAAPPDDFVVIGLDLARTHDWTALMALNGRNEWVDCRRVGHLDWSVQRIAVIEMYKRLNARKVVLDATGIQLGAEAVVYDLRREGLIVDPVHITGEIKRALVENLMLKFDMSAIRIPMEASSEFRQYSVEERPSGYDSYGAPTGKHDDYVMATALALWGNRHMSARPMEPQKSELQLSIERELRMAKDGYDGNESNDW